MKMTLLEMVTSILSDIESDPVTSITDTPESLAVASVIKDVYYQFITNNIIPELKSLFKFSDATSYVWFLIPTTVSSIDWFKYDKRLHGDADAMFQDVSYSDNKSFLDYVSMRKTSDSFNSTTTDPNSGLTFLVDNTKAPQYYTSFDDKYIVCDSFDSQIDTTGLLGSKTIGTATNLPTWTVADSFTPTIDDNLFPYLLAESKSTCFVNLKQTANPKIERQAKNQRIWMQNDKFRSAQSEKASINPAFDQNFNFGRRRGFH